VADGSVEFVGGNHVSTYAERTRGDKWVYLGQTVSNLNHCLVVKPDSGISKLSDLRGKVAGVRGEHPGLNTWLFLKQNGLDVDKGEIKFQRVGKGADIWEAVRDGQVDAAFVTPPADMFAQRAGLNVIAIDYLPMVWFTTVSSGLAFVDKHPDIVERFLKGVIEGIAYFKTHREESIKIIETKYKSEGNLDHETATHLYDGLAKILEPKLYATIKAVSNVYELAVRQDKAAEKVEPMALWDYHYLRRIDDSGFIDALYKN
jgi:ABC-type nitrate/sulfonate/bicarbonate transport system substrate-binding protein